MTSRHGRKAKLAFLDENHFLVSLFCSISNGGENTVTKFNPKVGQKCHQFNSVVLVFCKKLYAKLAVSQSLFLVPSRELISSSDSWTAPKFSTVAHHYLASQTILEIFDIRSPSPFFNAFLLRKITRFCNHELLTIERQQSFNWLNFTSLTR